MTIESPPLDALSRPVPLWRRLAPWVLAFAIVGFLLYRLDARKIVATLHSTNVPLYLGFVCAFALANLALDVLALVVAYRRTVGPVDARTILISRAGSYLPSIVNFHIGQVYLTYVLSRRYHTSIARVAGGTLFVYATNFGVLVALAAVGLPFSRDSVPWIADIIEVLVGAGVVYVAVLIWRPAFLTRRSLLQPLLEAGVRGHFVATAARAPHILLLLFGLWATYRFFGVQIPVFAALATLPAVTFVAALPITPQGVGARELVAIGLLSRYAPPGTGGSAIVAAGFAWAVTTIATSAVIGLAYARSLQVLLREADHESRPAASVH